MGSILLFPSVDGEDKAGVIPPRGSEHPYPDLSPSKGKGVGRGNRLRFHPSVGECGIMNHLRARVSEQDHRAARVGDVVIGRFEPDFSAGVGEALLARYARVDRAMPSALAGERRESYPLRFMIGVENKE